MLFPTDHVRDLLHGRAADELAAHAASAQRWKLFMLAASYFFYGYWNWRFCLPARPRRRSSTRRSPGRSTGAHPKPTRRGAARRRSRRQPRAARLLQVRRLLPPVLARPARHASGCRRRQHDHRRRAPGRHLVLHVPGAQLRHRRLPPRLRARTVSSTSRRTSRSSRTSSPDRSSVHASSCRRSKSRKDPRRIDASRAFFLIFIGLFKKVVIANFLATEIVDVVFASPNRHSALELLVGVYGVRGPDLRRLQRLHRHGDRPRAAARLPLPAELRRPVHRDRRCRTSGAAGT